MRRGTCGTFDVEKAAHGAAAGGWCLKDAGHAPPCAFGPVQDDAPLTVEEAIKIARDIDHEEHTSLMPVHFEAFEVLCDAVEEAKRLPRLLAPEEIPPGCTASLRAAIVSGPAAPPSAEASGPYTRAQFAAAVDEAHAALHEAENYRPCGPPVEHVIQAQPWRSVHLAHEALHRVGAGLERVDCATADPEAQRLIADLLEAGQREIPCGHKVEDLIYGVSEIGRPAVTKCGACLAALPKREPVPSRSFLPQGCSSAEIEAAAGVAARELVAERGAPAGTLVEVRLVRRAASQRLDQCGKLAGDVVCTLNAGHAGPHCPEHFGAVCPDAPRGAP